MPTWLMSLVWFIVEKVGAIFVKKVEQEIDTEKTDQKLDQAAKQTATEEVNEKDPTKLDQADSDLLSGGSH